jgi:hypothetical protein
MKVKHHLLPGPAANRSNKILFRKPHEKTMQNVAFATSKPVFKRKTRVMLQQTQRCRRRCTPMRCTALHWIGLQDANGDAQKKDRGQAAILGVITNFDKQKRRIIAC